MSELAGGKDFFNKKLVTDALDKRQHAFLHMCLAFFES